MLRRGCRGGDAGEQHPSCPKVVTARFNVPAPGGGRQAARRAPALCKGDSAQHCVSSDELKIPLQPPARGCCLDRQIWQGWICCFTALLQRDRRVTGPQLKEGDGAQAGGP